MARRATADVARVNALPIVHSSHVLARRHVYATTLGCISDSAESASSANDLGERTRFDAPSIENSTLAKSRAYIPALSGAANDA